MQGKKDITRVFDAETFILGVTSGMLGIIIAKLLTFPINAIIYSLTDLKKRRTSKNFTCTYTCCYQYNSHNAWRTYSGENGG